MDDKAVQRAKELGLSVVEAIRAHGEVEGLQRGLDICPVCHSNLFTVVDASLVQCPTCAIRGTLKADASRIEITFRPEDLDNHRFRLESIMDHYVRAILPSRERYRRIREQIAQEMEKYKTFP